MSRARLFIGRSLDPATIFSVRVTVHVVGSV
jgi:hypothetical protein